jgi:osmotically-inducible protein OsmY
MKTDTELQDDVIERVKAELGPDAGGIGVSVDHGTVMLTGTAPNCAEKYAAEHAALGVPGIRAISEGIQVRAFHEPNGDEEIAETVGRVLEQDESVPASVQATVEGGWVTLRGEVASIAERDAAVNAVRQRAGVERIYNLITVKPAG